MTTPTGLRATAEKILASHGHDLDDWILDQLDAGRTKDQIAGLLNAYGILVSRRQARRWADQALTK